MKITKNKKGMNDISIMTGIIFIIVAGAFVTALYSTEINQQSNSLNTASLQEGVEVGIDNDGETDITDIGDSVLKSFIKILFWRFELIPLWLDLIFKILEVIFAVLLYRQIRSGAG